MVKIWLKMDKLDSYDQAVQVYLLPSGDPTRRIQSRVSHVATLHVDTAQDVFELQSEQIRKLIDGETLELELKTKETADE